MESYSPSPRSKRREKRVSLYDISPEFLLPNPVSLVPNHSNDTNAYSSTTHLAPNTAAMSISSTSATMTATMLPPPPPANGNRFADITNYNGRSRSPSPSRGRRSSFVFPPPPSIAISSSPYKSNIYSSSRESLEQTAIDENSTTVTASRAPSPIRHSVRPKVNTAVNAMLGVDAPANTLNAFDFDGVTLDDGDGSNTATEKMTEQNGQPMPVNVTPPRSTSPVKVPRKPFNFQSTVASRSPVNKPNQRRGHKYKHSSVSMNFFLEPPPRPPPVVPAHFPVPTHKDAIQSMSRDQKIQLGWCSLHFLVGLQLWFISSESTVLMALSHIIFYDAFAATLSVLVDVLANFEVWKNSSIRHPFGLQRAEILAGFASTVGLLFMGIDIGSHLCENFMKHVITESSPHDHESERFYARGTPIVVIFSIMATVVSSIVFKNHERIGTAVQFSYIRKLKYGLNNPLYLTTLSSCLVILSLPLWTSEPWYSTIDNVLAIVIAFAMCFVGWMTAITLGRMLLMGFSGRCAQMILNEIQGDSEVKSVEDSRMWQVHYGLFIINIKLRLHGSAADETRVRANVNRIIGDVLKANLGAETMTNSKSPGFTTSVNGSPTVNAVKFRGKTGIQWESTIDIDRS